MAARLLTTAEGLEWDRALPAARSAFGSLGFARAQERLGLGEPRLLVAEAGGAVIAYPLSLRPLADLPFTAEGITGAYDSGSPPFTGPIPPSEHFHSVEEQKRSLDAVAGALVDAGVVAEFVHLHPWKAAPALVGGGEPDREIVWVDLSVDPEELWRTSYSKACRKNVKRSERAGVTVRAAVDEADIGEFHRIYIATMERNEARESYFFDREYFQAIFEEMPAGARFALAEHEGKVIAATLYLHDADDVYSYLGGADHLHQELRPTNAVVHQTIAWAREQGKRRLILGGGYTPNDGIMRFKAGFSPSRATLELARRVHLPDDYETLIDAWAKLYPGAQSTGFFPAYRAPQPGSA